MGAFGITRRILREELADLVGVRVGLAVGIPRIDPIIDSNHPELGGGPDDGLRMRAEDFSHLTYQTLEAVGDPWTQLGSEPLVTTYFDLPATDRDKLARCVLHEIHRQVHYDNASAYDHGASPCELPGISSVYATFDTFVLNADLDRLNEDALMSRVHSICGTTGRVACQKYLRAAKTFQRIDPWIRVHRVTAASIVSLDELFEGGQWAPIDGKFFDQRFANYLSANLSDVDRIHWRQFERLTAEYFRRQGYLVELGPGGNDDGVDVRAWSEAGSGLQQPLIIIQCKRQKAKIAKTVVKALWADVVAEKAHRGIIVTTSTLEPGARRTIDARGYGIDVADGIAISRWLHEMRTPGAGVTSL